MSKNPYFNTTDSPENMLLLRCDMVDFYLLSVTHCVVPRVWDVHKHFLLYPNPYPKPKHLKNRWHGHPVFPFILALNATHLELRASWMTYLEEFSAAVTATDSCARGSKWEPGSSEFEVQCSELVRRAASGYSASLGKRGPGPLQSSSKDDALTNFEAKYIASGQPLYILSIDRFP